MAEPLLRWQDAVLVIELFCSDPWRFGGIMVCSAPGPVRDRWLACLEARLAGVASIRRMPAAISPDALLGGLDWQTGLARGALSFRPGLLAANDRGVLLVPMAERLPQTICATLCQVLDTGQLQVARDGTTQRSDARVALVALDESIAGIEQVSAALLDRLAFVVNLDGISLRELDHPSAPVTASLRSPAARADASPTVAPEMCAELGDSAVRALAELALSLGIYSLRAVQHTCRLAALLATQAGRDAVTASDSALASRLILAPRATRLPPPSSDADADADADADKSAEPQAEPTPEPGVQRDNEPDTESSPAPLPPKASDLENKKRDGTSDAAIDESSLRELLIEATRAALPAQLLSPDTRLRPVQRPARANRQGSGSGTGAAQRSLTRGRPAGVARTGSAREGRLDLLQTIIAAAPWQRLRRESMPAASPPHAQPGLLIRREDFRIKRFMLRQQTSTLFLLDASGSAALNRLAEAKGAVEQLLAESYVRRDRVAVITFRGNKAQMVLPPSRSLVRARRCLVGLAGGGGTPLASGLDLAIVQSLAEQRGGRTPLLVVLTDGRANIARDGTPNRQRALDDARRSARHAHTQGLDTLWIDTSPRPQPETRELADLMNARYLALPFVDAGALLNAVKSTAPLNPQRHRTLSGARLGS